MTPCIPLNEGALYIYMWYFGICNFFNAPKHVSRLPARLPFRPYFSQPVRGKSIASLEIC